jgi:hypothetical protein
LRENGDRLLCRFDPQALESFPKFIVMRDGKLDDAYSALLLRSLPPGLWREVHGDYVSFLFIKRWTFPLAEQIPYFFVEKLATL